MAMQLSQILRRSEISNGPKTAIICGDTALSWNGVVDRVSRFAGGLHALGLQPGGRVAMLSENSHRYIEFYFGVPWAGGIFTPLNIRLTIDDLAMILTHSGADMLLVDQAMLDMGQKLQERLPSLKHLIYAGDGPAPAGFVDYEVMLKTATPVDEVECDDDDVAALFYTSGTSGPPKGVMLTHRNLFSVGVAGISTYGLTERSVSLVPSPFFHVAALAMIMPTLMAQGTVVIVPRFSPEAVLEAIVRHKVTAAVIVTALMRIMMNEIDMDEVDLSHLETILMGASSASNEFIAEVFERFGNKRLINAYGMTEATAAITTISHVNGNYGVHLRVPNCVGRAAPGVTFGIFDENEQRLPAGQVGQVMARGPNIMKGYWQRPDLTQETLRGGWLRTGDAGYLDEDGFLFLVDRIKDMIKTGGENVYSAEVERAVFGFPGVEQCAVVGVPDERWGEMVVAVVVPQPGIVIDEQALIEHCRTQIARYKCPRRIVIRNTPLPVNGANKIRKDVLRTELGASVTAAPSSSYREAS